MDQHLRSLGGLILTHTHVYVVPPFLLAIREIEAQQVLQNVQCPRPACFDRGSSESHEAFGAVLVATVIADRGLCIAEHAARLGFH